MADSTKPTPSLMDRITTSTPAAASSSWADEVASPTGATPTAPQTSMNSLAAAQVDGAAPMENGSGLQDGEYEVEVSLSALQNQQDNPLYSVTSFEELGLSKDILQGLYAMNFKKPSRIQEKTLPLLLSAQPINMIAQSQSGTGKTAAFVITVLSRIDRSKPKSPQALIIAPSRELARQIEGVVKTIGQFMPDLIVQAAVPGVMARGAQVQAAIVVGTPGTVMDLIKRKQYNIQDMKMLVLDEADNMLDQQGLGDQCMRLQKMIPTLQQTLLFSATFPDHVMAYATTFAPQAHLIKLQKDQLTVSGIKQMYMDISSEGDRYGILANLYGLMTNSSSIIFVKKRDTANSIAQRLTRDGHTVVAVHGAFEGEERDRILKDFREGNIKVLITTNVLARGIDVSTVSMVINYDIPMKGRADEEPDTETYLHRIGRTGRFGRVGVSISFVFDRKSFEALAYIANHYQIDLVKLDQSDWDACEDTIQRIIKSSQSLVA